MIIHLSLIWGKTLLKMDLASAWNLEERSQLLETSYVSFIIMSSFRKKMSHGPDIRDIFQCGGYFCISIPGQGQGYLQLMSVTPPSQRFLDANLKVFELDLLNLYINYMQYIQ